MMCSQESVIVTMLLLLTVPSNIQTQTPDFYQFFETAPIMSVNGSSDIAHCTTVTAVPGGTFICSAPTSSVLFDGDIPLLTGLDGDMWASQLLTLQPAQGISTLVAFDFTDTVNYAGADRIEVVMFNCPEWGISAQSITLMEASNILFAGTVLGTVDPVVTSCDSLVRLCIPHAASQPAVGLRFILHQTSSWVHLGEVTFYDDGSSCPPDAIIAVSTPSPEELLTPSPSFYRFFETAPITSVNGSSDTAHCTTVTAVPGGTFICSVPTSSVLFDGDIPIVAGLDGDMWASQLLTLQPAQGISTLVAFDFTDTPNYVGADRIEVVMFNCPEWGISAQSITLMEASNILFAGTVLGTVDPVVTSCDSLVRLCIPHAASQPAVGLRFILHQTSSWVHLGEVTFYDDGSSCPPDAIIAISTSPPEDMLTPSPNPDVPGAPVVRVEGSVLRWTTPPDNGAAITQYRVNIRSSQLDPVAFVVMTELTMFDLNDPQIVVGVAYSIDVQAENGLGVGLQSNAVTYTRPQEAPVIPTTYRFFQTGRIESVNGSSRTADCPDAIVFASGTFICPNPASSNLYDGDISPLMELEGEMWARELLTLQPAEPGDVLVAFDFVATEGYSGVNRAEVVMFNCPDWGISVQSISMLEARDVSLAGTVIATVFPTTTSCDSLVTVSVPQPSSQQAVGLQFRLNSDSNWVHLAEITFYGDDVFASPPGTSSNLAVIVGSSIGAISASLILLLVILVFCVVLYKLTRSKKGVQYHHDTSERRERSDENDYALASLSSPYHQFVVQSSYRLDIPNTSIISSHNLEIGEAIGQGEFGIVYKGKLKSSFANIASETVAVKTLKGFVQKRLVNDLLRECSRMQMLEHPNVLKLSGVCLDGGPAPYIIMPFMANGSLLTYLRDHRDHFIVGIHAENVGAVQKKLMDMTIQVGKGMEYLASKSIVHRDLAARNCMIDINFVIKVADFGLSESIDATKDYFRQGQEAVVKLPFKWLPPESITDGVFSEKSDVWSYGVTCWEIFSGGKAPYSGIHPGDLPSQLESGFRMKKPINGACSDEMYSVMLQCWDAIAEKRPAFEEIVKNLASQLAVVSNYLDFTSVANSEPSPLNEDA